MAIVADRNKNVVQLTQECGSVVEDDRVHSIRGIESRYCFDRVINYVVQL